MYTQCPQCLTIFEIDEEVLQASLGIVHCGHCKERFDALSRLSDTLPLDPDDTLVAPDAPPAIPTLTTEVTASELASAAKQQRHPRKSSENATPSENTSAASPPNDPAATDEPTLPDAPVQSEFVELDISPLSPIEIEIDVDASWHGIPPVEPTAFTNIDIPQTEAAPSALATETDDFAAAESQPTQATIALAEPVPAESEAAAGETEADDTTLPAPLYVRPRRAWFTRAQILWSVGCLVLAVLLAAQLAWAKRVALFHNAQTRPWVMLACQSLPCHLPPIHDVAKLELLSRDIRPDPKHAGALTITATLHNTAAVPQAWPIVVVKLTDLDNNPVAMRRFRPVEYMPDPTRRAAGIGPDATVAIAFEVADPGRQAINFQFGFQ